MAETQAQQLRELQAALGITSASVVVCCDWAAQAFLSAAKPQSGETPGTSWRFLEAMETCGVPSAVASLAREITNDASETQLQANTVLRNGVLGEYQQMIDTGRAFEAQRARIMERFVSVEPRHRKRRERWSRELKRHEQRAAAAADASRVASMAQRLASSLRRDHHAVIDSFLPDVNAAAEMGHLLHRMHANGDLAPGQIAAGVTQTVRGDLMSWVPVAAEQPPALRTVVAAVDQLILRLVREADVAEELSAVPLMRAEAQLTCYPGGGSRYMRHTDDAKSKARVLTCIFCASSLSLA